MKIQSLILIPTLLLLTLGCGLVDKFKAASGTDANLSAPTPVPAPSAMPAPSPAPAVDLSSLGRNLLAGGTGTSVASVTSESKAGDQTARHLIDEAQLNGWHTLSGDVENQSVTLELPARTTFKTFALDIQVFNQYEGAAPVKDFSIEVSDVSPADGFQMLVEGTARKGLRPGEPAQIFQPSREIPARWLRYTAKNRYGEGNRIFSKELRGYGTQEPIPTLANLTGTYEFYGASGTFSGEKMQLVQDGTALVGCTTVEHSTIFEGGIEGRIATLKSLRKGETRKDSGVMVFAPDGRSLKYIYWFGEGKKGYDTLEPARKLSDTITGNCANLPGIGGGGKTQDAVKDKLEKNLTDTGRAVLYGINFDFNSDVIKPESKPTLDKVAAILKENPDWKFSVEGHTDNAGGEAFNQTLSEKRAASVVKYLTGGGIDAARLSSKGYGLSKPLTANDTESGRAQNRRVEIVKQ